MSTYTWSGPIDGDWFGANWGAGAAFPETGDFVFINAGTVNVAGSEEVDMVAGDGAELDPINGEQIDLGSTNPSAPAAIVATEALFGHTVSLFSTGAAGYASLDAIGPTGFEGTIAASAPGGLFTIDATQASGGLPADFVLLDGGNLQVSNGDDLTVNGLVDLQANMTIAAGSTLTNDGTIRELNGGDSLVTTSVLNGTGGFIVGPDDTMILDTAIPSTQTIQFDGPGRINLGDIAAFAGQITDFTLGSEIDLLNTVANYASLNTATGLLTIDDIVSNVTTAVATLPLQGPASGLLNTVSDGAGGTTIIIPGSKSRTAYEIDTGDQAVGANIVRATMTTAAGAPITGAGIRIGIISDSFNATISGVVDPADTAAEAGYLPETAGGKSAVVDLEDYSGGENEGLAMAELVHQIAPGATIYFASVYDGGTSTSQTSFAGAVNALAAAGVNIIADDWSFTSSPFFQVAGPADAAVEAAMQSNGTHGAIDYFTDASNYDSAYFQANWNPTTAQIVETLSGSPRTATVQQFDNGTPYQTITIPAELAPTIALQWSAAWPSAGAGVPDELGMALYNMGGTIVAQSSQTLDTADGYDGIPEITLSVPLSTTVQQYQLAIYQIGSTPVAQFKYILYGGAFQAQNPGGTIDDPAASIGSGAVHGWALAPGVNAVGAAYWANSGPFGLPSDWTEYFSSPGPGQLLFDQNGNPIDQTVNAPTFIAPDGIYTSVPGFQSFFGTSAATPDAAAVAALMLQADPNLTTAQITSMLEESAMSMGLPAADQGAGLIQAPAAVELALAATCFAAGARIATADGEVAVEDLKVGDQVRLASGDATAAIEWIGRRCVDCRRHPRPELVWPVRISAHAFGPGAPLRDLLLSPDHAVYVQGMLIPVKYMINGGTIRQTAVDAVTYYHVELAEHAIILADGLPVESYLDTGDRAKFANYQGAVRLFPDFATGAAASWETRACARVVLRGPELEAARAQINAAGMQAADRTPVSSMVG